MWYAYEMQGTFINTETYRAYNKAFYEAMIGGINIQSDFDEYRDTSYWETYMTNAFQFSAAKNAAEMKMLQSYVFGKNGEKLPFEDFKTAVEPVLKEFNETWLRTEYDLAGRGAVLAENWRAMYKDKDLYPFWKYETRHDDRVRPEHAELNGRIFRLDDASSQGLYPPISWNCRCTAKAVDDGTLATNDEIEKYKDNIAPGFEGNVGIDGIFPKTKSSYFEVLKNANEAKPQMFDL